MKCKYSTNRLSKHRAHKKKHFQIDSNNNNNQSKLKTIDVNNQDIIDKRRNYASSVIELSDENL